MPDSLSTIQFGKHNTHFADVAVGFNPVSAGMVKEAWEYLLRYYSGGLFGHRCGVMSLWEEQKDLRADNSALSGVADLENGKCQNRYRVPGDKEPIISCFRNDIPLF